LIKEELIQLHTFLVQVRSCIEQLQFYDDLTMFSSYDSLHVGPHEVHKSKDEQTKAVLELSRCITEALITE
jgi:hypothetical protein